jgi:hypothetical protein
MHLRHLLIAAATLLSTACANEALNSLQLSRVSGPLIDAAFQAELIPVDHEPASMKPNERQAIYLVVTNRSDVVWPALTKRDGSYRIAVGNHWFDAAGKTVVHDDARTVLPYDLRPQQKAEVMLEVTAPAKAGSYVLEIDLVQEDNAWFAEKGSTPLRIPVDVRN